MPILRLPPEGPANVFGLRQPADLLRKLSWEIGNLRAALEGAPTNFRWARDASYAAFNAAVTSWHCSDWAWQHFDAATQREIAENEGFKVTGDEKGDLIATYIRGRKV